MCYFGILKLTLRLKVVLISIFFHCGRINQSLGAVAKRHFHFLLYMPKTALIISLCGRTCIRQWGKTIFITRYCKVQI